MTRAGEAPWAHRRLYWKLEPADQTARWLAAAPVGATISSMASVPQHAHDPVDDEVTRILADPVLRARPEDFERRLARGELGPGIPHAEARRLVGLNDDPVADTPQE